MNNREEGTMLLPKVGLSGFHLHKCEYMDEPPGKYMNLPSDRTCVATRRDDGAGVQHAMSLGSCTE